jgi:hypothetical protein
VNWAINSSQLFQSSSSGNGEAKVIMAARSQKTVAEQAQAYQRILSEMSYEISSQNNRLGGHKPDYKAIYERMTLCGNLMNSVGENLIAEQMTQIALKAKKELDKQ